MPRVTHPKRFPDKLYAILDDTSFSSVVGWSPDGRSFIVRKPDLFMEYIVPIYFKQTNIGSFTRQLYFWRFSKGKTKNEWMHKHFVRGNTNELQLIRRMEDGIVKSNHSKGRRRKPRNFQAFDGNDSDSIDKASEQGCAPSPMTSDCDSGRNTSKQSSQDQLGIEFLCALGVEVVSKDDTCDPRPEIAQR